MPIAAISRPTPRRSKSGRFAGSSDSPIWKRGWRSFSRSTTLRPFLARSAAIVDPDGPPPMTATSHSSRPAASIMLGAPGWIDPVELPQDPRPREHAARLPQHRLRLLADAIDDGLRHAKELRAARLRAHLHLARLLQDVHVEEGVGHGLAAGEQAVVAQDHRALVA